MLKSGVIYIYEVYRERSFSKAAQKLYVSQPALSAAIQREEARWGCTFFDRSRTPVELTEAGRRYVETVEKMMREQRALEEYFDGFVSERRKTLNIGAPAFFCTYVLPALVKKFGEEHLDAKVNIIEAGVDDLVNCLQAETIDVCIAVEEWPANAYKSAAIGEEEIVLAVPRELPVNRRLAGFRINAGDLDGLRVNAGAPRVSAAEFAEAPFLLLKKGNDMHDRALKIFQQARISPKVIMTLDQLMTSYHMAAAGIGAAFVRAELMKYSGEGLCFYRLDSPHTTRKISVACKKSRKLPEIVEEFIKYLMKGYLNGRAQ